MRRFFFAVLLLPSALFANYVDFGYKIHNTSAGIIHGVQVNVLWYRDDGYAMGGNQLGPGNMDADGWINIFRLYGGSGNRDWVADAYGPFKWGWDVQVSVNGVVIIPYKGSITYATISPGTKYDILGELELCGEPQPQPTESPFSNTLGRDYLPSEGGWSLDPNKIDWDFRVNYEIHDMQPTSAGGPYGNWEWTTATDAGQPAWEPPGDLTMNSWYWTGGPTWVNISQGSGSYNMPVNGSGYSSPAGGNPSPWSGGSSNGSDRTAALIAFYGSSIDGRLASVNSDLVGIRTDLQSLPAPVVNVSAPVVNVAAPVVNVPAPVVNVTVQGGGSGGSSGFDLTSVDTGYVPPVWSAPGYTDPGTDWLGSQDDITDGGITSSDMLSLAGWSQTDAAGAAIAMRSGIAPNGSFWASGSVLGGLGGWSMPSMPSGGGGVPSAMGKGFIKALASAGPEAAGPGDIVDRFLNSVQDTCRAFISYFTVGTISQSYVLGPFGSPGAPGTTIFSGLVLDCTPISSFCDAIRACLIVFLGFHLYESCRLMIGQIFGQTIGNPKS